MSRDDKMMYHASSRIKRYQQRVTELGAGGSLTQRKSVYLKCFAEAYEAYQKSAAQQVLSDCDAIELVSEHTQWMDDWIRFTWWYVVQEYPALMKEMLKTSAQKRPYLIKTIPRKRKKSDEISGLLSQQDEQQMAIDPAERAYYSNLLKDLEKEITELEQEKKLLDEIDSSVNLEKIDEDHLLSVFSLFARGGYGRGELTFSSDVDLGYCLDPKKAEGFDILSLQELIKRMEELFQETPLDLASQYFELHEDLTRFSRIDMLHTIPSILEGRVVLGSEAVLVTLKQQFLNTCPQEKAIRYLNDQIASLEFKSNDILYVKNGFGGLRHLQYLFWMILILDDSRFSNSGILLNYLQEKGWISTNDQKTLQRTLEFYFDVRNFIGLYDHYTEEIAQVDYERTLVGKKVTRDFLDGTVTMAYLKLKRRFVTVDFMDRFRLNAIKAISTAVSSVAKEMLNRTIEEKVSGFCLVKHLGSNTIIGFQEEVAAETVQSRDSELIQNNWQHWRRQFDQTLLKHLFLKLENLFTLFVYISRTGNKLSRLLVERFSELTQEMYHKPITKPHPKTRHFITDLFVAENASAAVEQMLDIAAPISKDGHVKTLLGLFIPEVNQMRFLLRNLDVHEYPLCIHSLKALKQVEKEIENSQNAEPELWRFTNEKDIFALKWATFFHDIGKINPYRNHERLGPVLSTDMLKRLGWSEQDDVMEMVRLLIANHQSVVRFSQLSTYLDLGILKFFELAQRNPRKVLLLYLINLSDFKSVNSEMSLKAAHLEGFFEKTMSILGEFRLDQSTGSLTEIVNNYLDQTVSEKRISVLIELLLRQCCNKNLEDVIIVPLNKMAPDEVEALISHKDELEDSLVFLKLAELDPLSLEKHRFRFTRIIRRSISEQNLYAIVAPLSNTWNWFFTAVPNRYLLSSSVEVLTSQLQEFEGQLQKKIRLSYVAGEKGEVDSILFHFTGHPQFHSKIAYALSWHGVNIENGKINRIIYDNGQEGFVGFFRISTAERKSRLSSTELENVIHHLTLPPLNPPPISARKKLSHVQVNYFLEKDKGYRIDQVSKDAYQRVPEEYIAVKISLNDEPFVYYKILRSFEAIGVRPQQVTITTIGNQIIDYFYITGKDRKSIRDDEFKGVLQKYINAEIKVD